ncbi:WD40/YVTN/BNR-like repeat-containing protein [Nocardioides stalactiti]|uniref:WD40/YVTN/BNR-like repeat-containing protein n=1 Tax=Nocardioides stalactiti TaxID=2755356 RepID=UPI0016043391|nr:hypothetical protein [Nocardioides stalactiti]
MLRTLRLLLPLLLLPLVAVGVTSTPAQAAVPDVWVKWDEGDHWIRSLDYVTPTKLVAGSETDGVFTSSTAAGPWTDISGDLPTLGKQVHEAKGQGGQIFLATSAGLYQGSGNGSWDKLGVDESTPQGMRLDQGGVQSIVFTTAGSTSNMVVSTAGSGRDGIFWSSDGGVKWTPATGITGGAYSLTKGAGSLVYAAAGNGFYLSTDSGKSWTLTSDGIPPGEAGLRIAVSPLDPSELIAATTSSVYRSDNAGLTWYDATGSGPGALLATQVRAFQLVPSTYWGGGEPRIVVGTNSGVWATADGGEHWSEMSGAKLGAPGEISMKDESVWALNIGFGTPGSLIAGTQGHGVFTLPLSAVESPGSISAPTGSATQGYTLTANDGVWGGTGPFLYRYQWKRCTTTSAGSCANIAGETGRTYTTTSADVGKYLRVGVRALNLVTPVFSAEVLSDAIGPIAAPAGPEPTPPPGYPKLLDAASAPWGATFTIDPSDDASNRWRSNGTFMATTFEYRWYRCDQDLDPCAQIPGQSGISYTSTVDDVGKVVQGTVVGQIGSTKSPERLAGTSGSVYERKPVNTAKPRVIGKAYVGTKLQSTAGAWTGTDPTFTRRWFRCSADGTGCSLTNPVGTASTYLVTSADLGYTFKVEVTATVTDQFQNRTEVATSEKSVKVTNPPSCADLAAAVATAKANVRAKKRALAKALETGNKRKIRIAKRRLAAAKAALVKAQEAYAAAGC